MDRASLISSLRQLNPRKADYTDEELLWEAANDAETQGVLDQYPVLINERIRQQAEYDAQDRNIVGNTWAAAKRGWAGAMQSVNTIGGSADDEDAQDVADWEKVKMQNPNSPEYGEFMSAKGFVDSAKAFARAPVRIITELVAESAAQSIPSMAGGMAGGAIQGAIAGAPTGPGEAVTIPIGAMIGAATGSVTSEYASKILEVLQSEGMDLSDPKSVQRFFNDSEKLERARSLALRRAIPVGLFDGATLGLTSKFGASGWKNLAKSAATEIGGGMTGELAGQVTSGEEINAKSIIAEGLGELAGMPGDIVSTARNRPQAQAKNETPVIPMENEAPEEKRASFGTTFGDVERTMPAAPVATPAPVVTTEQAPAPVAVEPAPDAPVLANFESQQKLVEYGIAPNEASTYTQDQADNLIADYEDSQAALEADAEENRIEEHAQAQAAAKAAAKANWQRMQDSHMALAQQAEAQAKAEADARREQVARRQAQLATQRDALANAGYPRPRATQDLVDPRMQVQAYRNEQAKLAEARDAQTRMAQKQLAKAAQAAAAAQPTVVAGDPVPANQAQAKEPVAPTPKKQPFEYYRDELKENKVVIENSRLVEEGESLESVLKQRPLAKASDKAGRNDHSKNLLVLQDTTTGKHYQIPVRREFKTKEYVVTPNTTRGFWEPILQKEFGRGIDSALPAKSKSPIAKEVQARAAEFGHGQPLSIPMRTWLNQNPNLQPIMVLELEQQAHHGFRPTDDEIAQTIQNQVVAQRWKNQQPVVEVAPTAMPVSQAAQPTQAAPTVVQAPTAMPVSQVAQMTQATPTTPVVPQAAPQVTPVDPVSSTSLTVKKTASDVFDLLAGHIKSKSQWLSFANKALDPTNPWLSSAVHDLAKSGLAETEPIRALSKEDRRLLLAEIRSHFDRQTRDRNLRTWKNVEDDAAPKQPEVFVADDGVPITDVDPTYRRRIEAISSVRSFEEAKGYVDTKDRYDEALRSALSRGLKISQSEAGKAMKQGGTYSPSKRAISLVLNNVLAPSKSNLLTLVHEVVHDITEQAPEHIRLALHDAFERLPVAQHAFYNSELAGDNSMESVTERMVEHLTFKGVESNYSRSIIAQAYRTIKDLLVRGAMYLQSKLLGESNVSGSLATTWADNQVAKFLTGDDLRKERFLDAFRATPSIGTVVRTIAGDTTATHISLSTGEITHERIDDVDAGAVNVEAAIDSVIQSAKANGTWTLARDAKALSEALGEDVMSHIEPDQMRVASLVVNVARREARITAAVANALDPIVRALHAKVQASEVDYTPAQKAALKRAGNPPAKALTDIKSVYSLLGVSDPIAAKVKAFAKLKERLQSEFGETINGPLPEEGTTVDQMDGGERAEADRMIYRWVSSVQAKLHAKNTSLYEGIQKMEQKEALRREVIHSVYSQLGDTKVAIAAMTRSLAETIRSLKRDLKRADHVSMAKGEAEATLSAIEENVDRQTLQQKYTEKALDSVDFDNVPLGSALKALYDLGLDLYTATPKEIRNRVKEEVLLHADSPLSVFLEQGSGENAKIRGNAMLTAMIRFVKQDNLLADTLRAQMARSKEDLAQLNEARDIWLSSNTASLEEMAETLKGLKPTGNADKLGDRPVMTPNLAHKMLAARDKALSEQAALAKMRRDLAVVKTAMPGFDDLARQAAQRLKVGNAFAFHTGAKYMYPDSPETSEENLNADANKKTLVLSGPGAMKPDELRDLLRRTTEWLDARRNDPQKQGVVYQSMLQQERVLVKNLFHEKLHRLIAGIFNGRFSGLAELFRRTGTRPGEVAARALTRFDGIMRIFANSDTVNGQRFETLRDNCIRVMGVLPEKLNEMFYDPALWFMQNYQGTEREAFHELANYFRGNEATKDAFERPGASEAFFKWLADVPRQNRYLMEKMQHAGADRVLDPELGDKERAHIETGVEGYTIPRHIQQSLRIWLGSVNQQFITGDSPENPFREATRLVATEDGLATLKKSLDKVFDEHGWSVFMRPLLCNELGGVPRPDGVELNPRVADEILDQTGNDLVAFADEVFRRYGGDDKNTYRVSLINWVAATWHQLDENFGPKSPTSGWSLGVPEIAINARAKISYPREWLGFTQFTPGDLRRMTHGVAATGAFGRNGKQLIEWGQDVDRALQEDRNTIKKLDDQNGWAELKKLNKAEYQRLQAISKYTSPNWEDMIKGVFNTESDVFTENSALLETFGASVTMMTSGFKTALKNLVTPTNLVYLQRSASLETMGDVAGSYSKFGKLFFAALADCVGVQIGRSDPFVQAMLAAGAFDAANFTTVKDLATGERGVNDSLGAYARTLRRMRNVFVQTRLSPLSKGSPFPGLRLLNPFQFTQLAVNMANCWQLMQTYNELATNAAEHYKQGGNPAQLLSAKDCGVRDETRFLALKARLADNGMTLEDLGQRLAKGQSILDRDFVQAMNNMSTGDLANEGSVNNRPVVMSRHRWGRVYGTFVGWGIAQTNHVLKLASTQEGRTNLQSLAHAMKVFTIGMLPMSLAMSAALDEWDELVDRKSNRRKVDLLDPQSISEALVAVGTTGLLGDAIDYTINTAQGTSGNSNLLSLDNRIVMFNQANALLTAVRNAVAMGDVNYANSGRPLLQAMGAGGIIQNAYLMDKVLNVKAVPLLGEPFAAESSVMLRSNLGNYLRAAGREVGLEVRRAGGGDYTPTPITPHVTDMMLSALQNKRDEFQAAYKRAIQAARVMGKPDPLKAVQQAFEARHPLKSIFQGRPTIAEYHQLLAAMPDSGKKAVEDGVRLVNLYGSGLGVAPFTGSTEMSEAQVARQIASRNPQGALDRLRSKLADDRMF